MGLAYTLSKCSSKVLMTNFLKKNSGLVKLYLISTYLKKSFEIFRLKYFTKAFEICFLQNYAGFYAAVPDQWCTILWIQNALNYRSVCTFI
jgi:hypothetical protein